MTNDETSLFPVFLPSRQLGAPASSHGRVKTIVRLARNVRRAPFVIRHSFVIGYFVIRHLHPVVDFALDIEENVEAGNVTTK